MKEEKLTDSQILEKFNQISKERLDDLKKRPSLTFLENKTKELHEKILKIICKVNK